MLGASVGSRMWVYIGGEEMRRVREEEHYVEEAPTKTGPKLVVRGALPPVMSTIVYIWTFAE